MIMFASATYLKDVKKHKLSMTIKNNIGICIKKILDIEKPFILNEDGKMIKILDNDYYILEIIPFNKNYILRVHLDNYLNVIERYYLITKNNCIIDGVLSYYDLKLAYVCTEHCKKVYNQEKISQMKINKDISVNDYRKAINTMNKIISEISNGSNDLYNMNYIQLIKEGGF